MFCRGEIPEMNKILDKDDVTIMKRAIYATQVSDVMYIKITFCISKWLLISLMLPELKITRNLQTTANYIIIW